MTRELAGDLVTADREYLLLRVRALTFGGGVDMVLNCPDPECGAPMSAWFEIEHIPFEQGETAPSYSLAGLELAFRLPRGADLEELAGSGIRGEEALERLLERCTVNPADAVERLRSPALRLALAEGIERVAPRADFDLEALCPQCGRASVSHFDPTSWFSSELSRRQADFEREIHLLAMHYHWSLRELLALPRPRRTYYVRLLLSELDRQSSASAI